MLERQNKENLHDVIKNRIQIDHNNHRTNQNLFSVYDWIVKAYKKQIEQIAN